MENLIFFRLSEFLLFQKHLVYLFAVFNIVFDTGLGGNTDRLNVVLYLCFIVFIF